MQEQLYPFTKNRYFRKKRMRAVDFERDQSFADHKLAFLGHWVFGTGVAFGLGVSRIDSDSLLVDQGLAIDSQGRFLIVDEPTIARVRSLPGFDTLQGETATLWLSYQEEQLDPMFVADDEGQTTQYAVAKERFSLSLSDEALLPQSAADQVLLSEHILYEDDEVRIVQSLPKVLSATQPCQLKLYIQCHSLEPLDLELRYAPEIPGFSDSMGQPPLLERHIRIEKGETELNLSIVPVQPAQVTRITVPERAFSLEKRGVRHGLTAEFSGEFSVVSGDIDAALAARLNAHSIQDLWDIQPLGVPIANVRFVRYDDKSLLDDVLPLGGRHLAFVPGLQARLKHTAARFQANDGAGRSGNDKTEHPQPSNDGRQAPPDTVLHRHMSTGTTVLNVHQNMKAGSILTSDEIVHGLGPGTVYVEFGIEHIYPVANRDENCTDLLLGDVSLFEQASGTYDRDFNKGIRVHPDKGTFEMAVRGLVKKSLVPRCKDFCRTAPFTQQRIAAHARNFPDKSAAGGRR